MCTVTYVPVGDNYVFTSSRDEHSGRQLAEFPMLHQIKGQRLLFPRDPQGGGTWIVVHESGDVAVLLNGAHVAHKSQPPYIKSRGLILLDLMTGKSLTDAFKEANLNDIEPFTVILFEKRKLYSCKWDGTKKYFEELDELEPHIWSSVTLYEADSIRKRETWFRNWVKENPVPTAEQIIRFHFEGGDGDPVNDILMNRKEELFTNSISSIQLSENRASFRYLDLRTGNSDLCTIPFKKEILQKA
jgi:uncharacterized protein with NRDE domain